jgi:hypothetical protein
LILPINTSYSCYSWLLLVSSTWNNKKGTGFKRTVLVFGRKLELVDKASAARFVSQLGELAMMVGFDGYTEIVNGEMVKMATLMIKNDA